MSLWPHQVQARADIETAIKQGVRNLCVTCPTGGGKSRIMFEDMNSDGTPKALYTDRRMLLDQLSRGLDSNSALFGVRASGVKPRLLEDIQLCMVQTEASRVLKKGRDIHPASKIYIDELHKNGGAQMVSLLKKHRERRPDSVMIGFTATPLGIDHMAERLIIAGTNSELRRCGALVKAYHYGPDEPDTKWVGKVAVGEGECGLALNKRMEFAHRVFGSVIEHYMELNPEMRPAILFAPGVKESIWFAEELCAHGIKAAHIDGENVWVDGVLHRNDAALREEIAERHQRGEIKVVCNRFVLREGINWPWIYHGIFATVFGSLTSYLQAGGRILRAHESLDHVVIQDHGGNWYRHGSLNEDREWKLGYTDRIVAGMREQAYREKQLQEPIVCPKCHAMRLSGPKCWSCGYEHTTKSRLVLQKNGSLREMKGDIFRKRIVLEPSVKLEKEWTSRVNAVRRSQKETVKDMTYAQLEVSFARDHNWRYAPRTLPEMPVDPVDWFRPVKEVTNVTRRKPEFQDLPSARTF